MKSVAAERKFLFESSVLSRFNQRVSPANVAGWKAPAAEVYGVKFTEYKRVSNRVCLTTGLLFFITAAFITHVYRSNS